MSHGEVEIPALVQNAEATNVVEVTTEDEVVGEEKSQIADP